MLWLAIHVWSECRPNDFQKPAIRLLSNFSSLSHYLHFFFWQNWVCFFCRQKEKYREYSSSSFVTYSLLFPASIPLGSDGVAALASGRLDQRVDDTDIGTGGKDLVEACLSVDQLQLVKLLVIHQLFHQSFSLRHHLSELCYNVQVLWPTLSVP